MDPRPQPKPARTSLPSINHWSGQSTYIVHLRCDGALLLHSPSARLARAGFWLSAFAPVRWTDGRGRRYELSGTGTQQRTQRTQHQRTAQLADTTRITHHTPAHNRKKRAEGGSGVQYLATRKATGCISLHCGPPWHPSIPSQLSPSHACPSTPPPCPITPPPLPVCKGAGGGSCLDEASDAC